MKNITKTRVALVDMGERLPIDLNKLSGKLNSKLNSFEFSPAQSITAARIGDPTIADEWHDVEILLDMLRTDSRLQSYDLIIGFTHYKITEKASPPDSNHRDYFCLSDFHKVSVISLNDNIVKFKPPGRNLYQYAAFLSICELLINLAKKDMVHSATNFCLFDDCEDRLGFRQGMEKGEICTGCLSKLEKAGVSRTVVIQAQKVLKWCKYNSLRHSIIQTLCNPIITLALGTAVGWTAKSYVPKEQSIIIFIPTAIIIIIMLIYTRYFSK